MMKILAVLLTIVLAVSFAACGSGGTASAEQDGGASSGAEVKAADMPESTSAASPTAAPMGKATASPTAAPTGKPTVKPTPTVKPAQKPTAAPTNKPGTEPTAKPTVQPTEKPAVKPTEKPASKPTSAPTARPTAKPTSKPTTAPTAKPTETPAHEHDYSIYIPEKSHIEYKTVTQTTVEPIYEVVRGWYECKKCHAQFEDVEECGSHCLFDCDSTYTYLTEKKYVGDKITEKEVEIPVTVVDEHENYECACGARLWEWL